MNFKILVAGSMLALAASASHAQADPAPLPLVLTPSGAGMFTTTFERDVNGIFVDSFSFTPASFSGTVAVSLKALEGPVSFFSATLNSQPFSVEPDAGQATFDFEAMVDANTPLDLQLLGFAGDLDSLASANGRYGLTINAVAVAAIPEPETYGLMLAGLALMGWMTRSASRRKTA